jgi:hypothetical protein
LKVGVCRRFLTQIMVTRARPRAEPQAARRSLRAEPARL